MRKETDMRTEQSDPGQATMPQRSRRRLDLAHEPLHPAVLAVPYVVAAVLAAVTAAVLRRASRP